MRCVPLLMCVVCGVGGVVCRIEGSFTKTNKIFLLLFVRLSANRSQIAELELLLIVSVLTKTKPFRIWVDICAGVLGLFLTADAGTQKLRFQGHIHSS